MKTTMPVPRTLLTTSVAFAMAMAAWLPNAAIAADESTKPMKPMKGAEHLMMLSNINTQAEAEALKPGDSIAMVCAECKSVAVERVTVERGHIRKLTVGEKHLCLGCNSTIKIVGMGKGAKAELKHTCEKCGDDSAFCCATKPGSGTTEGMQKK